MTGKRDISAQTIGRAKSLRRGATFPERLLWGALRNGRLAGLKFRRQEAIGPFVVDFCCYAAKLIVELDGRSHDGRQQADRQRTELLQQQGFEVLRCLNDQVLEDLEPVVMMIERIARARAAAVARVQESQTSERPAE